MVLHTIVTLKKVVLIKLSRVKTARKMAEARKFLKKWAKNLRHAYEKVVAGSGKKKAVRPAHLAVSPPSPILAEKKKKMQEERKNIGSF